MIDLLALAGLPRRARQTAIDEAVADLSERDPDHGEVLSRILRDPVRRMHYERTHLQYQAIAAALPILELPGTLDTHRWGRRVVDFEPDEGAVDQSASGLGS